MGIPCKLNIAPQDLGWQCAQCMTPLAQKRHHIPGEFTGKYGDANFLSHVVNVKRESAKTQSMLSGKYVVQTLSCRFCDEYLGWAYVKAYDPQQHYKVGKYCLEAEQTASAPTRRRRHVSFRSDSIPDKSRL